MRRLLFAAGIVLFTCCLSARADTIYTLSSVSLSSTAGGAANDGTLSGTFTVNSAGTAVTSYDITASKTGAFAGFEYTTADSTVTAETLPSQYFQIDSTGDIDELRLYFTSGGLKASGGTISGVYSYEHEPSGGNRYPSGAVILAVAATPEPSSIVLLGTGLLGAAGVLRKRFA